MVTFNAQFSEQNNLSATLSSSNELGASFEAVQNVNSVFPSDDLPLMDGVASAGDSTKFSRSDHVHPNDSIKLNTTDYLTNMELQSIINSIFQ